MREARQNTLSSKCLIKETPTSARPGIIITSNLAPETFFDCELVSQSYKPLFFPPFVNFRYFRGLSFPISKYSFFAIFLNNSRQFPKIPDNSRQFPSIPDNSRQFPTILDNSRQFSTIPDNSRHFLTIPNNSRQCQQIPDNSQQFPTILDNSRQFPTFPDNSQQFPTFLNFHYLYVFLFPFSNWIFISHF